VDGSYPCLERKSREIALLDRCLRTPLQVTRPESLAAAIERKYRLAAVLKADQLLDRWSITETAHPPTQRLKAGRFTFSFGYQRADLEVQGPSIYPGLQGIGGDRRESTIYTGSGMGAIAALLNALLQFNERIELVAPQDCYVETRELMTSLGSHIQLLPLKPYRCEPDSDRADARVLWIDSSVQCSFSSCLSAMTQDVDLVVFDTTCFWRCSTKITRAVERAVHLGIPIALVRSHGKLDSLGIEYGRLGSVVLEMPPAGPVSRWGNLAPKIRDAVRLFGAGPILAHFPPFENSDDYQACSMVRTASIIRGTRRLASVLRSRLPPGSLTTFQHGLFLTIALGGSACIDELKRYASELSIELAFRGFPVKHAGSFGFDFVAVESCSDPIRGTNAIRIAGADLPIQMIDEIGHGIATWLGHVRCESSHGRAMTSRAAAA
jgi:hypothetical protein